MSFLLGRLNLQIFEQVKMVRIVLSAFAAAAVLLPCIFAQADNTGDAVALAKREKALSKLSPYVRNYLSTLDESEYELSIDEDEEEEEGLVKRQQESDSGVWKGCKNSQVAVTYDDGAYQWRTELDSKWNSAGHAVSYFVNGNNFAVSTYVYTPPSVFACSILIPRCILPLTSSVSVRL